MPGFDHREVSFVQARYELMRAIDNEYIAELPEPDRGERVARIVRDLKDRYPDLDDQMGRRLHGEGMRVQPGYNDPV